MKKLYFLLISTILVLTFSASAWAFNISFIWNANSPEDNVTEYRLYYQKEGDSNTSLAIIPGNITTKDLDNLDNGNYSFWLTAVNAYGESLPTPKITKNMSIPSIPTGFGFTTRREVY